MRQPPTRSICYSSGRPMPDGQRTESSLGLGPWMLSRIPFVYASSCSSSGYHPNLSLTARTRCALYDDFNISTKQGKELHETFGRKTSKLAAKQPGSLWSVNLQCSRHLCLADTRWS